MAPTFAAICCPRLAAGHTSPIRTDAETRERLFLLDQEQRDVVANVLRYLESRWKMKKAGELLRNW
jgi:hypothetical protein